MSGGYDVVNLFGEVVDPFVSAKERYGTWPITVWDIESDADTRGLKKLIGDDGSARDQAFTTRSDDRSVYRGKVTATIFNPSIAAWLLNMYAPPVGLCFDPFAGGGTRAIMAAKHGLVYVGVELREAEVVATRKRADASRVSDFVHVVQGDARNCGDIIGDQEADFLLTCPPYWNLEQYDGGPADLSMAPTYEAFLADLETVIKETARALKPGATACWVVGLLRSAKGELIPLHHDVARLHRSSGFKLCEEIVLAHRNNGAIQRVGNFEKGHRHLIRTHEYALVFQRIRP